MIRRESETSKKIYSNRKRQNRKYEMKWQRQNITFPFFYTIWNHDQYIDRSSPYFK